MRQAGEPSVEEILESIKKVIARDSRVDDDRRQRDTDGAHQAEETAAPQHFEAADEDEEILDLADSEELEGQDLDLLELEDEAAEDAPNIAAEQPLVTTATSMAMRESLAALAMMAAPSAPPRIVRSGETSLEDLARELLRPAIAEWLETHLPAMVERMVASEIARIVGKKG